MKKLYSKKLGGEAFALDAAQLDTLKKAGYTVPSPEEVIADAAAVRIEPPEGKRAYVAFDFKTGAFAVRTRTQTLTDNGLLHAPSAEMQRDKTFMVGGNFLNKELTPPTWYYHTYNYFLSVTIFPFLEIEYNRTILK